MSTRPPVQRSAAPAAAIRSGPERRSPPPYERLCRLSDRMDMLTRDVGLGARSQSEHERHVAEAESIAHALTAIFRAPTPVSAPVHPPLKQQGGRAWW